MIASIYTARPSLFDGAEWGRVGLALLIVAIIALSAWLDMKKIGRQEEEDD